MIVLVVFWLSVLLFAIGLLWILIPALYGLPPVPTKPERIRRALEMARLQPDETLYDLGAGDGRVLFMAARDFGAKAVGVEIGPVQCAWIWLRAVASGLGQQIQIKWENYYKADLSKADVVFVYATSKEVLKLAPHLETQMKKGARLVSISADFREWEPSALDEQELIFVYEMPPVKGSMLSFMLKRAARGADHD
ncbi:MAG TPA: class I SAM-dependent methyltransferase [Anaerolineales bacterium]|nr:class I SAM-dependent methyltransferase [Anaerolineales bacterium]